MFSEGIEKEYWPEQKQSFADVLQNRCSSKFYIFHKKTTLLEFPFNKV